LEQFATRICHLCSYYGLFKNTLDKFLSNQDIIYDYKAKCPEYEVQVLLIILIDNIHFV